MLAAILLSLLPIMAFFGVTYQRSLRAREEAMRAEALAARQEAEAARALAEQAAGEAKK